MSNLYPITVDYDITVEDAIKAGNYDEVYDLGCITQKNFPIQKKGKSELVVEIIKLDYWATTEEVLKELDRLGYRPVDLMELLAFGAKYPDVQREFTVVALGSMHKSHHGYYVWPTLHVGSRWLTLSSEAWWFPESGYATVRK